LHKAGYNLGKGLYHTLLAPVDAAATLGKNLGEAALQTTVATGQLAIGVPQKAHQGFQFLKRKIGEQEDVTHLGPEDDPDAPEIRTDDTYISQ